MLLQAGDVEPNPGPLLKSPRSPPAALPVSPATTQSERVSLNQHAPADTTWAKSAAASGGHQTPSGGAPPTAPNICRSQPAPAAPAAAANKCRACACGNPRKGARHFSRRVRACPCSCHRGNKFSMLIRCPRAPPPGYALSILQTSPLAPPPPTRPGPFT